LGDMAIATFKDYLPKAVGKHGMEAAQRFAKLIYVAVMQNADLQKCTPASIIKAASLSASLNLDIDQRGFAYLVPYKNEANFQIGYLGLMELAYRSNKVKAIDAHCIYESEKDSVIIKRIDGQFSVEHKFSYEKPSGKIVAVYATAQIEGYGPRCVVLRTDQVEAFRARSKCPNSPAWKNDLEAMYKKTAIRQLAKFLPKSAVTEELSRGAAIDEKEDFSSAAGNACRQIEESAGSQIIDTTFMESQTAAPPPEQSPAEDDWRNG
jgi:recombination protein RecT